MSAVAKNEFRTDLRPNGGGGGPRNQYGLTIREENFARHVAAGETQSEAYRQAYRTENMKPGTIWREAHVTAKRPWVRDRIDGLREAVDAEAIHDAVRIRSFIVERLWNEAGDMTNRASERLKALELLGKLGHVGAFIERTEVSNLSPEAIKSRIQELLLKCRTAELY